MDDKAKEDIYEFKSSKDVTPVRSKSASPDLKEKGTDPKTGKSEEGEIEVALSKRLNTDNDPDEADDDSKRRRKDNAKGPALAGRGAGARNSGNLGKAPASKQVGPSRSPPTPSPKVEDAEDGEKLGPKVPPLKIVIPQSESEQGSARNGKNNQNRHPGLPYIISSSSNDSEKDGSLSPNASDPTIGMLSADDKGGQPQRVLRSHRTDQSSPPTTSGNW